ncbi:MAG: histidine phosphotransferase family protein [Heliomarina sp.]|uniref:histidine phosphotransferase family protein n=1 Tax=Heliomarina sp. TaxID=2917556 RepID=UPI0040582BE9
MTDHNLDISVLVGSRICHDLISPIGAIANGLELLELTGATPGPEMELISTSVRNANARIRFFRIAFGAAGEQMMGRKEIMSVLKDISKTGRIEMSWVPSDPHPRPMVRLAFLALLCCETALPQGGTIRVDQEHDHWKITGTGNTVSLDPVLWNTLGEAPVSGTASSATVQFPLLAEMATKLGRKVEFGHDPERVEIRY